MKKTFFASILALLFLASCGLTSNTNIKPNDSFILGNNKHAAFRVRLKNVSKNALEVYHAPIDGGKHSGQDVSPNQSVSIRVAKNTALIIDNKTSDPASVNLHVTGDTGLSMGYKH